ncbi:MAG: hypothetical protein WC632_07620, partial [Candidatus Margulisiibacteriota bacterium]
SGASFRPSTPRLTSAIGGQAGQAGSGQGWRSGLSPFSEEEEEEEEEKKKKAIASGGLFSDLKMGGEKRRNYQMPLNEILCTLSRLKSF